MIGKGSRKSAKPKASHARCAPHHPGWSFLPCEGEACCL